MYLSDAEATPELKDFILAYHPEMIDYRQTSHSGSDIVAFYLSFVKKLVRILT